MTIQEHSETFDVIHPTCYAIKAFRIASPVSRSLQFMKHRMSLVHLDVGSAKKGSSTGR